MTHYLVVVDMQNDFIDGALGTPEAQAILPPVAQKIRDFTGAVLFTLDTHTSSYLETQEGRKLPVVHCVKNTDGWRLPAELEAERARRAAPVFSKPTFGSQLLAEYLWGAQQQENIESITFVGLCTDICVISNALLVKAFLPETEIIVESALCAGVTPDSHATALAAMKMCQINVL